MSRKHRSKSSRSSTSSVRRVSLQTANAQLPLPSLVGVSSPRRPVFRTQMELFPVEDRRTFHPDRHLRSARTTSGRSFMLRSQLPVHVPAFAPARQSFDRSSRIVVCVRRQIRKQVMFATRKAGRSGQKRPVRNFMSSISCKG